LTPPHFTTSLDGPSPSLVDGVDQFLDERQTDFEGKCGSSN